MGNPIPLLFDFSFGYKLTSLELQDELLGLRSSILCNEFFNCFVFSGIFQPAIHTAQVFKIFAPVAVRAAASLAQISTAVATAGSLHILRITGTAGGHIVYWWFAAFNLNHKKHFNFFWATGFSFTSSILFKKILLCNFRLFYVFNFHFFSSSFNNC